MKADSDDPLVAEAKLARFVFGPHATRAVVERSLARMPGDVREWAIRECVFGSIGGDAPSVCQPITAEIRDGRCLVMVDAAAPSDLDTLVAPEVAHAFLGPGARNLEQDRDECERKARELARQWGLSGSGVDEQAVQTLE